MKAVGISCTALFAGASLYATAIHFPATKKLPPPHLASHVRNVAPMGARLDLVLAIAGSVALLSSARKQWPITHRITIASNRMYAGTVMLATVPFSLMFLWPIASKFMLNKGKQVTDTEAQSLFELWTLLYAVRTAMSAVALILAVLPNKWDA